jgi:ribonuclease HI
VKIKLIKDTRSVSNRDLILYVLSLIALRSPVKFLKVKAHCGIEGNEAADRLAKAGAIKGAIQERNYFEDTQRNEALLTRSGRSTVERFVVEISESDLLTYEELRMMELSQDFNS